MIIRIPKLDYIVNIGFCAKIEDVDYDRCQIRINAGKGKKDRIVPFPTSFKEVLAMHADKMRQLNAVYLFESNWKRKYTDRGVRKILEKYVERAGIKRSISPHRLRTTDKPGLGVKLK